MKIANMKQALYINRLSYTLYKLDGCVNKRIIIFPDEAQQLPFDIAEDMINELKKKIYAKEMELYVYPYIHSMDKLVDVNQINKTEYCKVDKVKPLDNSLAVTMSNGNEIVIKGEKKVLVGNSQVTLNGAYEELVKAINHDLEVMVYTSTTLVVISVKDTEENQLLVDIIETMNDVLEIMGNKMPISWDGKYIPSNLKGITYYLDQRDKEVSRRFNEILVSNVSSDILVKLLNSETVK